MAHTSFTNVCEGVLTASSLAVAAFTPARAPQQGTSFYWIDFDTCITMRHLPAGFCPVERRSWLKRPEPAADAERWPPRPEKLALSGMPLDPGFMSLDLAVPAA